MSDSQAGSAPEIWIQEFKVHSYEVDLKRAASLETICRYFLDAAWNHAEALGIGYSYLRAQGKLWVLSRLLVSVRRSPLWGEPVRVQTWPRTAKSAFAMRDFELLDASGAILASGSSAWLILDSTTRRPQRIEKLLAHMPTLPARRAVDQDPVKLQASPTAAPAAPKCVEIRYSDIDVNSHVNSCRYIGLLLDSYPLEFHSQYSPTLLEINYLGETRAGETVLLQEAELSALERAHVILKAHEGQEVCRARIGWRPSV